MKDAIRNKLERRRNAVNELVPSGGVLHAAPVNLVSPFYIGTSPLDIMIDSKIEPWNSWAKVQAQRTKSADVGSYDKLSFYFLWDNPYDYYMLVNAYSSLVVKGVGVATGNTGFLSGGYGSLFATAHIEYFEPAGDPPDSVQGTETKLIFDLQAQGGGFWSMETGQADSKAVFATYNVRDDWIPIHPRARAVFEVSLSLKYTIFGNGEVHYDFANNVFDYFVQCPSMLLTLLSPTPQMM